MRLRVVEDGVAVAIEERERVARRVGPRLEIGDADRHRKLPRETGVFRDEAVVSRDGQRAPRRAVAGIRSVEGRVADAPHLGEQRDVGAERGRATAERDTLCAIRVEIAWRRTELEQRDAERRHAPRFRRARL